MLARLTSALPALLVCSLACSGESDGTTGDPADSGGAAATGGRATGGQPSTGGGSGGTSPVDPGAGFGETFAGVFHLGPVDWEESVWNNACSPYDPAVIASEGQVLAGLQTGHMDGGRLCDACVLITAADGTQVNARVVTYGDTGPNDIDVSPAACAALTGDAGCDVWPREMTWQFAQCPDTGRIAYQFQTGANVWWTSFWVRNARLPLASVEVQSANHPAFTALEWNTDGTVNDGSGFGDGEFTLRLTAVDGQTITDTFPGFTPGELLESSGNFE
jgi:hypothetical protein